MEFLIAVVMGFYVANNGMYEKRRRAMMVPDYTSDFARKLSEFGGYGGWFCILPAAFLFAKSGGGFLHGIGFIVAAFGGSFLAGFVPSVGMRKTLSVLTLPVNLGMLVMVWLISR